MDVIGRIKFIGSTQQVSDKFSKREVVVTTNEQYPQHISVEFNQDKCGMLDKYAVGDSVTVGINLRGREWTDQSTGVIKHFNTIQGWSIKKGESVELPKLDAQEPALPF